jgi:PAS domain S-box-containing protein
MNIRYRIMVFMAVALLVLTVAISAITHWAITQAFDRLEESALERTITRMQTTLGAAHENLTRITEDWAYWDDTYDFVQGNNPDFVEVNFKADDVANLNLQLALVYDAEGQLVYGCCFDRESGKEMALPLDVEGAIPPDHPLLMEPANRTSTSAYMRIGGALHLVSSAVILDSTATGESAGILIFGRLVDPVILGRLGDALQHPVTLYLRDMDVPGHPIRHPANPHPRFGEAVHFADDIAYVHQPLHDPESDVAAILCAGIPREIHQQLGQTLWLIAGAVIVTVLILGTGLLLYLERTTLGPAGRVISALLSMNDSDASEASVPEVGKGEVLRLSRAINQLLQEVRQNDAERQAAMAALSAEKENLATTLNSIADGIITTDAARRVIYMNPMAEKLTGWRYSAALDLYLSDIFCLESETSGSPVDDLSLQALSEGQAVTRDEEVMLRARDGHHCPVSDSYACMRDAHGQITGVVVVFRAMTEFRKAANEHLMADKLEAIGVLAGGIAHDFNNLLTALLYSLSLARRPSTPPEKVEEYLKTAEASVARGKGLTSQLLTFSSGGIPIQKCVDVPTLIRQTVDLVIRDQPHRCHYELAADLAPGWLDDGQVAQALHNIILNAVEAMPVGGNVQIKARNARPGEDAIPPALNGRPCIVIEIADQGMGIPPEIQKRIFEPYFTTKDRTGGLGLASAHSIITKHGGSMRVESELDLGTRMTLILPACDTPDHAQTQREDVVKGNGRILFMDDEELLVRLCEEFLTEAGYQVETASGGAEAVQRYQHALQTGNRFDLVILDLKVPGGMGGHEALREMRAIDPDVRAIVSSGYSNDSIMANYADYGFVAVLTKPYTSHALTSLVAQILS